MGYVSSMGRAWRIESEVHFTTYYPGVRGNEQSNIFWSNTERGRFLDAILELSKRFQWISLPIFWWTTAIIWCKKRGVLMCPKPRHDLASLTRDALIPYLANQQQVWTQVQSQIGQHDWLAVIWIGPNSTSPFYREAWCGIWSTLHARTGG